MTNATQYTSKAQVEAAVAKGELSVEDAFKLYIELDKRPINMPTFEYMMMPAGTQTSPNRAALIYDRHIVRMKTGSSSKDALSLNATQAAAFLDWLDSEESREFRKAVGR